MTRFARPSRLVLNVCGLAVTSGLLLSACGGNGDVNASAEDNAAEDLGSCGTLPVQLPEDPDGVVAALPENVQAAYNGYSSTVHASPWADWAPEGSGPYDVAVVFTETGPPYQATLLQETVAALEDSDAIGTVTITQSGRDVGTQVSNFQAAIRGGADLILYQAIQGDALIPLIDQAAEEGIPSVAMQSQVETLNSVDITPNPFLLTARPTAELVKIMGGEGQLLGVHGVPGVPIETDSFNGINAVLSKCPDIALDDSVVGNYNAATTKSEVQRYLSTHPQQIDGVVHAAIMGPGIVQAFTDAGRPVPPIADAALSEGVAAYWTQHQDEYEATGSGQGAAATADVIAEVVLRMLNGDGIAVSDVVLEPPLITEENLEEWATEATDLSSAASLEPPAGTYPPEGFVDAMFE